MGFGVHPIKIIALIPPDAYHYLALKEDSANPGVCCGMLQVMISISPINGEE